ncbi:MAG: glycosyltransferase family 2 protein [Pirellulales bacterium]
MKTPLRVLLPVYNAEHRLPEGVVSVLEVLPEFADRFELVIIDDGSTDDTAETARSLAAQFPQVSVIRHPVRLGLGEAIQTGLDEAAAEIILFGNGAYELDLDDLRTLWRLRDTERETTQAARLLASPGKKTTRPRAGLKLPLSKLPQQLGFQMIHRSTFDELRLSQAIDAIARIDRTTPVAPSGKTNRPNFLDRVKRLALGE